MSYLLILFTTVCTLASQLMLKQSIQGLAEIAASNKLDFLLKVAVSPWVLSAVVLQLAGYVVWLFVVLRENLGIAFALSGAFFYLIMALLSWLLFDERLSVTQWAGIGTITFGVLLLVRG